MSRPKKAKVDYFPHMVHQGKTIYILEKKFGNDGYAFWFKTLELLGDTENHFIDCNDPIQWEFLIAKTLVSNEIGKDILETLVNVEAIDKDLWKNNVIWCENFILNLESVYNRREVSVYRKPDVWDYCQQKYGDKWINVNEKPQSKVEESKEKKSKEIPYIEIIEYLNSKTGKSFKAESQYSKKHIKVRWNEGFRLEDFKKVIDNKCLKWLSDPKMIDYIRPETLFGTKFESYLNEKEISYGHKKDDPGYVNEFLKDISEGD